MTTFSSERILVRNDVDEVNDLFYARGWTDGFPIIPPTPERVARMLEGTTRAPADVVGKVPPRWARATVEKIAIAAVMAGALPSYMPAIIATLEATLEPQFDLYGVQTTTHPVAPLTIFNGPIIKELDINYGYGCFGPGRRANATIGRALRLILLNIGGGIPGNGDMATHGRAEKYTYVIAENEEANPWEPLHVERGFDRDASTVTVYPADAPHNAQDHENTTAAGVLTVICDTICTLGTNHVIFPRTESFIILCPEHAETIAREGWAKNDVKRFIYEYARMPAYKARLAGGYQKFKDWPKWMDTPDDHAAIPMHLDWKDVVIVVAGGGGKHSVICQSVGRRPSVTRAIKS